MRRVRTSTWVLLAVFLGALVLYLWVKSVQNAAGDTPAVTRQSGSAAPAPSHTPQPSPRPAPHHRPSPTATPHRTATPRQTVTPKPSIVPTTPAPTTPAPTPSGTVPATSATP